MKFLVVTFSTLVVLVSSKIIAINDGTNLEDNISYGSLNKLNLLNVNKSPDTKAKTIAGVVTRQDNNTSAVKPAAKIVYGAYARLGDFPYQAGIIAQNWMGQSQLCGGSLITANRVLTAAHCWWNGQFLAMKFTVTLGSVNVFSGGIRLETSTVITHGAWDPYNLRNDIAMAYLPVAVQFSSIIRPIALPSGQDLQNSFAGESVIASGFGLTRDDDNSEKLLRYVRLQVITNAQCSRYYRFMWPHIICTKGATYENTCRGDSGGPIAIIRNNQPILVGITSFGSFSCETGEPSGFTRVTSYMNWINSLL